MPAAGLRIRPAVAEDAPLLARLSRDAILTSAADHYTASQLEAWARRRTVEAHEAMLRSTTALLAVDGDDVVGFATLALEDTEGLVAGEVDQLFVAPDHAGRGIALRLLSEIQAIARQAGLTQLVTHASWRAVPVFTRAGFREVEVETVEVDGEQLTRVCMRLELGQPRGHRRAGTVQLVRLSVPDLEALVAGDLQTASRRTGVPLTPYFVDEAWLWRIRLEETATDPGRLEWIARAAVDPTTGVVVGHVGFHGPPDEHGTVEVAYSVDPDPDHRGRGWATAMLRAALDWAAADPGVRTVRASVSPGNTASLATLRPFGFQHVGEQWDEQDGRELLFERPARS